MPSFPVHGIDIANLRLCSSTMLSEAACPDVRDLIVNGRASKSQHNGGECSVLEELVKPDFSWQRKVWAAIAPVLAGGSISPDSHR